MIGFTPPRWQELRERYRNLSDLDKEWAMYIQRDSDGMVHCAPLLSGMVATWASEIMEEDLRRDHTYAQDYTQRLRDGS